MTVVAAGGYARTGEIVTVKEVLDADRVLVVGRADEERVVRLAGSVAHSTLRVGDSLTIGTRSGLVFEVIPKSEAEQLVLEEVPDLACEASGACGRQRVRIGRLAGSVAHSTLRVGDSLTIDTRSGFVFEVIPKSEVEELVLEEVPDIAYEDIGGLGPQIEQIRDAVELPFTHPDLFREHGLHPPKGVLLYGPPGCGKTLIAKAV